MTTLSVRNLPADVHRELRLRAARKGRSMEAEARAILSEAVGGEAEGAGLGSRIAGRFRGAGLEADLPELRGWTLEVPDLER